uniref:hypothetical protein n=1 Tax=Flavonifractor sp. TaxID=2049025 RepID=UPI003080856B
LHSCQSLQTKVRKNLDTTLQILFNLDRAGKTPYPLWTMMTVKIERNLSLTEVKNRFLRRVMATKKMQWLQVCTKNQIATQQSGCGLERSRGRYDVRGDMSCVDKKCILIRAWD